MVTGLHSGDFESQRNDPAGMTCSVRILSTTSVDSSPAILLVAPNGNKTLVNCGEGCQRVFLEFSQKLSTVNRVCVTHLSHTTLGGLPGMILTSADVHTASAISAAKQKLESHEKNPGVNPPKRPIPVSDKRPGLDIVGPEGIDDFINSLRHFMRREAFELRIHSGVYYQQQEKNKTTDKAKRQKSSKTPSSSIDDDFHVQSIACDLGPNRRQALSFIFTTPPIQGKFMIDKAKQIGIPPGPLYGHLKSGRAVTFVNPSTGVEQRVESCEVLQVGSPGVAVAILYYPDLKVLGQLKESESLSRVIPVKTKSRDVITPTIELMIHITSHAIFDSSQCFTWRSNLSPEIQHVFLDTDLPTNANEDPGTPFHSTSAGASCRSKLCSDIFLSPVAASNPSQHSVLPSEQTTVTMAVPLLEYTIIPRGKKGFSNQQTHHQHRSLVEKRMLELLGACGAVDLSRQTVPDGIVRSEGGEIIFTGTGSAVPCKHRNVSGIYLQMANLNGMLLDVGEGTVGQLVRAKHLGHVRDILRRIRAVWISHPHADHHLGILRLLAERNELLGSREAPVMVIAPTNLLSFLKEYELVDPQVRGSYVFLDCQDISCKGQSQSRGLSRHDQATKREILDRLLTELGITGIRTVPVQHCTHSYAVELRGTSFGTVAYSGDCRPSRNFAEAALDADLLIHEATFTDGMEAEASLKRHCTVGEALGVATQMNAKSVVLTHFSQRFPKIPPITKNDTPSSFNQDIPVVFAFDYMRLTPTNLLSASKMTPALRLLYPQDTTVDGDDEDEVEEEVGSEALAIPGLFAQKELL